MTKKWVWNIQRARVEFPKQNSFLEIVDTIAGHDTEIAMLTELWESTPGIKWIKARNLFGVLVHSQLSGIFLRGEWAVRWQEEGCLKEYGNRNTSVTVGGVKLVSTYQSLWNGDLEEFRMYREELQWMIHTPTKLVVGGDFNSSVGDLSGGERNETAGPYWLGRTNDAANDQMNWCLRNNLQCANSFFRHRYQGTWKPTVTGAWHEIDGFLVKMGTDKDG